MGEPPERSSLHDSNAAPLARSINFRSGRHQGNLRMLLQRHIWVRNRREGYEVLDLVHQNLIAIGLPR